MSTLDLINAIDAGKSTEIESSFNEIFASKVSAAIDAKRLDIAGNLFQPQVQEESVLEQFDDEAFYDGSNMLGEDRERSSDYKFTHHPGDAESEKKLADLKASVKGTGKRVVLQGRLGKNNPNADKYKQDAARRKGQFHGGHAYQRIAKADAAHHDVYVYDRK